MRPEEVQPAAVKWHNEGMIAICVLGLNDFSISQHWALGECLYYLKEKYRLNNSDIKSHSDINPNTLCPSYELDWIKEKFIKKSWGMKWK